MHSYSKRRQYDHEQQEIRSSTSADYFLALCFFFFDSLQLCLNTMQCYLHYTVYSFDEGNGTRTDIPVSNTVFVCLPVSEFFYLGLSVCLPVCVCFSLCLSVCFKCKSVSQQRSYRPIRKGQLRQTHVLVQNTADGIFPALALSILRLAFRIVRTD